MAVSISSLLSPTRLFKRRIFNVAFKNSGFENLVMTNTFARNARRLRRSSDGLILAARFNAREQRGSSSSRVSDG
jgi:hypothetical protein